MESLESLLENARFLAKSGQADQRAYVAYKRALERMELPPARYQTALRALCDALGL